VRGVRRKRGGNGEQIEVEKWRTNRGRKRWVTPDSQRCVRQGKRRKGKQMKRRRKGEELLRETREQGKESRKGRYARARTFPRTHSPECEAFHPFGKREERKRTSFSRTKRRHPFSRAPEEKEITLEKASVGPSFT